MGVDVELDSTCLVSGVWNEIELISLDFDPLNIFSSLIGKSTKCDNW